MSKSSCHPIDNLPKPKELAGDIITNLQADLTSFQDIANGLKELGSTESTIMETRS